MKDCLKAVRHPGQVTEFLAYHRRLDQHPVIRDIHKYGWSWEAWNREL